MAEGRPAFPHSESDGDLAPAAHAAHYEWAGFDVLAITDHWKLTRLPSTEHLLLIPGAELAVDPIAKGRYSEIIAIGIDALPEDPGGDRRYWEPIDNYEFKTFPDYAAAAAVHQRRRAAWPTSPTRTGAA